MLIKTNRIFLSVVVLLAVIALIAGVIHFVGSKGPTAGGAAKPEPMAGMDMPNNSAQAAVSSGSRTSPDGYSEITINRDVQQRIGVKTGRVEQTPLAMTIHAVGIVRADETRIAHIHLKTEGWIEQLFVSYTGQKVKAGQPMLTIYSPTYFAGEREFLSALKAAKSGLDNEADQQTVVETARRRLELWDIPKDEILRLEQTGKPDTSLLLRSPISGTVLQKDAFAGQYVTLQNDLFVVANLSTVWMEAKVFQYELPHVSVGMPATMSFPGSSHVPIIGKVVFIDPTVDETSRSVQVRIELRNPSGTLLPGMFGDVVISQAMGSGLTIPTSAVIRTGERDVAFRVLPNGQFEPVVVKISPTSFADRFEVLAGLNAGDLVVTSGNFLVDSESRLEAGAGNMADMPGMAAPTKSTAAGHKE
jgi:Cu(I)/Ag(I) efflux system membrane fusion protein